MKKKSPEATVVIATHKKTILPSDSLYLPLFVGAELKPEEELPKNYKKDNTGKNISKKNPEFCELKISMPILLDYAIIAVSFL